MPAQTKNFSSKEERNIQIIQMYLDDIPIKILVDKFKLTKQSIYNIIKNSGMTPKNPPRSKNELLIRNTDIINSYIQGIPMTELAEKYGLTRQGVQLILKSQGLNAKQGGASIRAKNKKIESQNKKQITREDNCLNKWGCTLEQWESLRKKHANFHLTPIARYIQHRSNIKRANLIWQITLWEWWTVWEKSGHYNDRGRGKNKYCMTRIKENGSYTKENVVITTISENLK